MKGASAVLPLDDSLEIHKAVGIVILGATLVHTLAHLIYLKEVCLKEKANYLTYLFTGIKSIGYPTGVIELVLLLVILVFAMPVVRNRGFFQMFYWCHMLTIPWLLIMLFHGKSFWVWLLAPAFCYTIEKILRHRKVSSNKFGDTFITDAVVLPSKVTHLVIRKPPKFKFNPGDYVFINIPIIAKNEWHPFSISSAPERSDVLWLHVRAVGNWTRRLYAFSMNSKFDVSSVSVGSQKARISMRSKMSKNLTEQNMSDDVDQAEIKKIVSFEPKTKETLLINDQKPIDEATEMQPIQQYKAENTDSMLPIALRHKGILKVIMQSNDLNAKSFNDSSINGTGGNPSSRDNHFPTESTPKSFDTQGYYFD